MIKFLLRIFLSGSILFLSKCWGGRATDKCITVNSGFSKLLELRDLILVNRGFDIDNDVALHNATLVIPSSGKVKDSFLCRRRSFQNKLPKFTSTLRELYAFSRISIDYFSFRVSCQSLFLSTRMTLKTFVYRSDHNCMFVSSSIVPK